MPLTVRLDETLTAALERHCEATGRSKSLVVQECLSGLLMGQTVAPRGLKASRNLQAFENAGLVGAIASGEGADKAAVRRRIAERLGAKQRAA